MRNPIKAFNNSIYALLSYVSFEDEPLKGGANIITMRETMGGYNRLYILR